jgi:hypothetical protein
MNGIIDFRRLQRETHKCSDLTTAEIDYLKSPAYLEALEAINGNPEAMAKLTCGMLQLMALNPLHGGEVKDFALGLDKPEGSIYFMCDLNRVCNPVGYFELPRDNAEAQALLKAIETNLGSRMFRAAVVSRRLERGNSRRYTRFSNQARAAFNVVFSEYRPAHGHRDAQGYKEVKERADAAYDAVYTPLVSRMEGRVRRVCEAAFLSGMSQGWTDILAAIAVRFIRPQLSA